MSSISGTSASPFSVSAYSTRGGTSGKVLRATMPSSSSARRRSDSVRGLIPSSERSSSQKRLRPSARSRMTKRVHLPQTTSAVRQTGQRELLSALIFRPSEASRVAFDRLARASLAPWLHLLKLWGRQGHIGRPAEGRARGARVAGPAGPDRVDLGHLDPVENLALPVDEFQGEARFDFEQFAGPGRGACGAFEFAIQRRHAVGDEQQY